ncbi:MAG: spore protease YyaC [bacterium]|jgi:putative sporulation protein YyaC
MPPLFSQVMTRKDDWRRNYRISCHDSLVIPKLSALLGRHFQELLVNGRPLLVLCIGTDRSTGDALGPLTGTRLQELNLPGTVVRGTLEKPVHAANLESTIREIEEDYSTPLVLALDACLGRAENVGTITVSRGALRPGAGVNKELPPVGELYITGTVNVGGFMEYFVLQNTRLGLVHKMAMTIASAIQWAVLRVQSGKEEATGEE